MNGKHHFAWQEGARAFFADVELDASPTSGRAWTIEFGDLTIADWRLGVQLGVSHFRSVAAGKLGNGAYSIKIQDIQGKPADTTLLSVAFATFHALTDAAKAGDAIAGCCRFDPKEAAFVFVNKTG